MIGRVLDTTALVDFATRRTRYVEAVIWSRISDVAPLIIPVPALTAALAQIPAPAVPILDTLLALEVRVVDDLTANSARSIAAILKIAGPYAAEALTAASVVHAARRRGLPIVTGNPFPLRALAADVEIDPIP